MKPLPPSKRHSSNFEYWSVWLFYLPIYFRYLMDAIRSGSFTYFAAANPGVHLGGLLSYSKAKWLLDLPEELRPKTLLFEKGTEFGAISSAILEQKLIYPLIIKPDHGERGKGVHLVKDAKQLNNCWQNMKNADLLIQQYIDLPVEAGVLLVKPKDAKSFISSFMIRELLTIQGNGIDPIEILLKKHARYSKFLSSLRIRYPKKLTDVPQSGESVLLEPIGNHNRGTVFRNANSLISPELVKSFEKISDHLEGFSFGRFDVKAPSLEMLCSGEGVKIVEINGVNSEPAHIYDPDYQLFKAYKDLWANWGHIYSMAKQNRASGFKYPGVGTLISAVKRQLAKSTA